MKAVLAGALLALVTTTAGADQPRTFNYTYSNLSRQQRDHLWSQSVTEWKDTAPLTLTVSGKRNAARPWLEASRILSAT
jgi:hypothetical protein